jgi:hypothetical protein
LALLVTLALPHPLALPHLLALICKMASQALPTTGVLHYLRW